MLRQLKKRTEEKMWRLVIEEEDNDKEASLYNSFKESVTCDVYIEIENYPLNVAL